MSAILLYVLILVPIALVVLAPGIALLGATRLWRLVPPLTWLPAAACGTLLLALPVTGARLYFREPVWWTVTWLAVATVVLLLIWRRRHRAARQAGDAALVRQWRARTNWRTVGSWTCALAVLSGFAGAVGTVLNNDSAYHIGVVQRMLALPGEGFLVSVRHPDAPISATYAMPLWHDVMAAVTWAAGAGAIEVVRIMPALLIPLATLAYAGAARQWFGPGPMSALTGAAFGLVTVVLTPPRFDVISVIAYPGFVTLYVVFPVLLTFAWASVWETRPDRRRWARAALAALILLMGALHANYIVYAGLALAGYAMLWLLLSRARTVQWRGHLGAGLWALAAAAVAFAGLYPVISRLERFARGTGEAALGSDWDRLGGLLFEGSRDSFHLYPGQLMAFGGAALAGIVGLAVLLVAWRSRGAWLFAGFTVVILAISLVDQLFSALLALGNATVAFRIFRVIPVEVGLAALITLPLAAHMAGRLRRTALVALVLGVAGCALASYHWHPAVGELASRPHPAWPVELAALGVALAVLTAVARALVAQGRETGVETSRSPFDVPGKRGRATAAGLLALGVALSPQLLMLGPDAVSAARERLHEYPRGDYPRSSPSDKEAGFDYPGKLVRAVGRMDPGQVVLADPIAGWDIQALGPVYGAADYKRLSRKTERYGQADRYAVVRSFWDETRHADRLWILNWLRPDAVLVRTTNHCARSFAQWFEDNVAGPIHVAGPGLPAMGGRVRRPHHRWRILEIDYPRLPGEVSPTSTPLPAWLSPPVADAQLRSPEIQPLVECEQLAPAPPA